MKFSAMKKRFAAVTLLVIGAVSPIFAHGGANGCPDPMQQIETSFCENDTNCAKSDCMGKLGDLQDAADGAKSKINQCTALTGDTCGVTSGGATPGQKDTQADKSAVAAKGAQCQREKGGISKDVGKSWRKACDAMKKACKKYNYQSEFDKCDKAAKDALTTADQDEGKAKEMDNQKNKADDNAKKEGGGMPQMPQIPQMPQNQDSQPDTSTATNPSITSDSSTGTAGAMETSKLDGGSFSSPGVGFGSSGTNTNTSTTTDAPGYVTPTNAPVNMAGLVGGASPLGSGGSGGGFGSFGSAGGGGAAGGGGSQNTTGASAPGPTGSASSTDSPYEVGGGGGGKLGAPKGFKSGGDSDSAIADAAKGDFKADVGDAARNPAGEMVAQAGDEESDGFTVFKMVHSRYIEIKKRGSL